MIPEITQTILNLAAMGGAMSLLFSQTRELTEEGSKLAESLRPLINRLLHSTSCDEDKQQLEVLQKKIREFEERNKSLEDERKILEGLISQSEKIEKWLAEQRDFLVNQSTNIVVRRHSSINDSDRLEISEKITDYLYLIHRSLHWGRPNLIDFYFRENPSINLRLKSSYYKEALNFIIGEEMPKHLFPDEIRIAQAYFEYLMKNLGEK